MGNRLAPSSTVSALPVAEDVVQSDERREAIKTLLVEDDPDLREMLELVLTLRGQRVTAIGDGEQAWRAYREGSFPLVVLDWMLPGLDGLELCRRIRAAPGGEATVIMAITGRDRPRDLRAMLAAGANDYLSKPFEMAAFEVRMTVAEQGAWAALQRRRTELLDHDRNQVLERIARNEPLGEILAQLAALVERQSPDTLGAVLLVQDGRLRLEAAPSLPPAYVRSLDGLPIGPASATLGAAVQRGAAVVSADVASDPLWRDCSELAAQHGLRACWAMPILAGSGQALGVFAIYARQPRVPEAEDLRLLETGGRLAALAIEHARLFDQAATVEALHSLARLKSEFLSTVSHELRTPLSLIYGYAELLKVRAAQLSTAEIEEMAAEVHTGSGTMIRLVDDLLDFARVEQGRLRLDQRRVDVAELLRGLLESFRHQPGGERITAELPAALVASVDPERLAQIVGNLISNALRYAPNGPIALRAGLRRGDLWLEVADRGPGIPADEQPRVWEKFYRSSLAMSATARGSGLGLAVVRHLVELQGGRVGLRSEPGRGATFWLTLPVDAS